MKWMKSRIPYYSNSTATFNILTCGDIHPHPHPGPKLSAQRPDNSTNNKNSSVLRCFYQNARSLKSENKLRDFQDTVYVNQYDIVAITETWLTSEISDTELLPWRYEIFRWDRLVPSDGSSRGGEPCWRVVVVYVVALFACLKVITVLSYLLLNLTRTTVVKY